MGEGLVKYLHNDQASDLKSKNTAQKYVLKMCYVYDFDTHVSTKYSTHLTITQMVLSKKRCAKNVLKQMAKCAKTYQTVIWKFCCNLLVVNRFARIGRTYEDWPKPFKSQMLYRMS